MSQPSVPRPKRHDPDVERRHMALIRDRVAQYLRTADATLSDEDLDHAMQEVQRAMQYQSDGYRIAEALESRGWHADAELVEFMDGLASERGDALDEAVEEWVKAGHGGKPGMVVGARVKVLAGLRDQREHDGEVVRIDDERARCTVMVAALGHVRTGYGTHGFVLDFDDVEILPQAPDAAAATV